MRFILLLALALVSCHTTEKSDNLISDKEEQIAKDLIQGAFDDLWGGLDSTKMLDYHTDDFIILEQGEIWDNDRIKEYMRGRLVVPERATRINMMDYISIEKYGSSMQIAYHNKATFHKNDSLVGKAAWLESALAVETPVGWRLKMMHSTRKKSE